MSEESWSNGRQHAILLYHVGILPVVSAQAGSCCSVIERFGGVRGIVILFPEEELDGNGGHDVEQRACQVS